MLAGGLGDEGVARLLGHSLIFRRGLADSRAGGFQDTVQTAQQREGQDNVFVVFGILVILDEVVSSIRCRRLLVLENSYRRAPGRLIPAV